MNVLLLPDTETSAQLVDRLLVWSRAGLLRPFCLRVTSGPADAKVSRIRDGEAVELPLGDALEGVRPEEVEFTAFYPLALDEEADADFAESIEAIFAWVGRRVFPVAAEHPLSCSLVIAPASPEQMVPPELFRANWLNLLIAAEDRAGPGEVNQLQGDDDDGPERYLRHAAHAAATTAAIWATATAQLPDPLAQIDGRPGPFRVQVRVVRCFSRVVELGHIADHLAAVVFEPRRGWPRPGTKFERPADVERLVAGASRAYLDRHRDALAGRPFEPIREDPPARLNLLEALQVLIAQVGSYLRRRPFELIEDAIEAVHDKAARRIESLSEPTGRIHVRLWSELPEEDRDLSHLGDLLDDATVVTEDGAVGRAWTELRQTALGLIDGSDLPDEVAKVVRGPGDRRLVIADPGRIARDPELTAERTEEPLLPQIRAAVQAAKEAAEARAEALREPETEVAEEEDLEDTEPPRRGLLRGGGWVMALIRRVGFYCLAAMVCWVLALALLPLAAAAGATVVIGFLWLWATARLARRELLRPRLPQDEDALRELAELNRALERTQSFGDARRLERRLIELDTWIAILAELVHRPWVREPFEPIDVVRTTDEATLPAACAVAVARPEDEHLDRIGARARSQTFTPGWLSSVYRAVRDLAMRDYNLNAGEVGPPPDPEADLNPDEDCSRNALLAAVRRGDGRRRRDNPMAEALLEEIESMSLDELAPGVEPPSPEARPLSPTAIWIAPPEGVSRVVAERGRHMVGLRGWSASAVIVAPNLALAPASILGHVTGVTSIEERSIRIAEKRVLAGTGLGILRFEEDEGLGAGVETLTSPPRLDEGVVAFEAAPAGAATRWGFVISEGEDLAILYERGAPGLGAAVFDLAGRLVAIHGERGVLLPVPEVDRLLEIEEGELPVALNGVGPHEDPVAAAGFLASIAEQSGAAALLHPYWAEPTDANAVERVLPPDLESLDLGGPVARLGGEASYLRPLRVMVHRVEVTRVVEPAELTACAPKR